MKKSSGRGCLFGWGAGGEGEFFGGESKGNGCSVVKGWAEAWKTGFREVEES